MSSLFFKSFAAGAAANLMVTHGLNINSSDPLARQRMALQLAALGFMYGVVERNSATIGFALGMATMAAAHYAMHLGGEKTAEAAHPSL